MKSYCIADTDVRGDEYAEDENNESAARGLLYGLQQKKN
jgi:hypothetical protein